MWNEFKQFAFKGNAFDLAVGIIMGIAFGKIVQSMVDDLIMQIIGAITGGAIATLTVITNTNPLNARQNLLLTLSSPAAPETRPSVAVKLPEKRLRFRHE